MAGLEVELAKLDRQYCVQLESFETAKAELVRLEARICLLRRKIKQGGK